MLGLASGEVLGDPWFLPRFVEAVSSPTHYAVLRPASDVAMQRATNRAAPELVDPEPIALMYRAFGDLGPYERHVIDTTELDIDATISRLGDAVAVGALRVG